MATMSRVTAALARACSPSRFARGWRATAAAW